MRNQTRFAMAMALVAAAALSSAGTMLGNYTKLSGPDNSTYATHVDVQKGIDGGIVSGLVQSTLGPNGLPVASAFALAGGFNSGPLSDVNANNELQWFTPHTLGNGSVVQSDGSSIDAMNLNFPSDFYATGETGNGNWMRAGHWSGIGSIADGDMTVYNLSLDADDDAWLFINGNLVLDNGGVKAMGHVTSGTISGPGVYQFDVFFADRNKVQSGIRFNSDLNIEAVPEPASMAVLGLGATALFRRRKSSR